MPVPPLGSAIPIVRSATAIAPVVPKVRVAGLLRCSPELQRPGLFRRFVRALTRAFTVALSLGLAVPAAEPKQGAALLKTDLMAVFAHPDDETGMAATLAHYALGQGKQVATVYCTRGEGGGNMVGTQAGPALGILREAELRDCLARLGVRHCYFLDQADFAYTENLQITLERWDRTETLRRLVRLVRSLQPEVIVTMNPAPNPGQHGNHQAAAVLAAEAFALAADRAAFPEQLTTEGLSLWQPRKLYFSGAGESAATASISTTNPIPAGPLPSELASLALANHRSQGFGGFANAPWLRRAQLFRRVRSATPPDGPESDLFAGLPLPPASSSAEPRAVRAAPDVEVNFLSRPALDRYREWTRRLGINGSAPEITADLPVVAGGTAEVRIELRCTTAPTTPATLRLVPGSEALRLGRSVFSVQMHSDKPAVVLTSATIDARAVGDLPLDAILEQPGREPIRARMLVHPVPSLRVARLSRPPPMDGTDRGFEPLVSHAIDPHRVVQGRVNDEADSSGRFRMGHHGRILYIDLRVQDDVVVSNIEPNDIKGHWRSDSIEVCIDGSGAAEHTLNAFKIGVFPFDTSGVVRAARDADANQGPVELTAPGTRIVSRREPGGYRVQLAIPFAEAGLSTKGTAGFNLILYDGDKSNAAPGENINKSRLAWAPRPGVQGRPEDWGRIQLD